MTKEHKEHLSAVLTIVQKLEFGQTVVLDSIKNLEERREQLVKTIASLSKPVLTLETSLTSAGPYGLE